ncbi:MAG TPA: hypothetical protein VJ719_14515 [Chthoniobacterales bacterium]|nr:hypothetical protein [Chthoniobacterales bacterium]
MRFSRQFFRFAAACALASALTTLAVHVLPALWADAATFEQQVELRLNSIYMAQRWTVLVHCLLVIISMFAIGVVLLERSPALATLGFLSFFVFGVTEIFRTSLSIFAVNRTWRSGYAAAGDDQARQTFRDVFTAYTGVNDALFFVFYTAFVIGLLCYGFALARTAGFDRLIGGMFLVWALVNVPVFIDTVIASNSLGRYFEWVGPYFQPLARICVGIWLWRYGSRLTKHWQSSST